MDVSLFKVDRPIEGQVRRHDLGVVGLRCGILTGNLSNHRGSNQGVDDRFSLHRTCDRALNLVRTTCPGRWPRLRKTWKVLSPVLA